MKIIHILPERVNNLTSNIVKFFANNFDRMGTDITDHLFIKFQEYSAITNEEKSYHLLPNIRPNQMVFMPSTIGSLFKVLFMVSQKDIVVIHSGRIRWIWLVLLLMPRLWKRTILVTWGGEIYVFKEHSESKRLYDRLICSIERIVVPRLKGISTLTPEEYNILQSVFNNCDNYFRAIVSSTPSTLIDKPPLRVSLDSPANIKILLNQSANQAGRHLEALDLLSKLRTDDIIIFCPLSYGPCDEAERIIQYGEATFGVKFRALRKLLCFEEYRNLVEGIDILVYNHLTQNGLGSLYMFLSKGKVVYLRKENPIYKMLRYFDIEVRDTMSIPDMTFDEFIQPLPKESVENNVRQFNKYLSSEGAAIAWRELFRYVTK